MIVLAVIERYRMDEILKYTADSAKIGKSKMMKNYNQRKAKKLQMNYLLHKVKNSSSITFQTRKIQELTELFGERRCKSMFELSTGWLKEDDPRKIKTWPISRSGLEEMEAKGIKAFTLEDSFAL